MTENGDLPLLPRGLVPFASQVAGHKFGSKTNRDVYGFLDTGKGELLKPITLRKGDRELHFYELLKGSLTSTHFYPASFREAEEIRQLTAFVPAYFGSVSFEEHPGVTYCRVLDVTQAYSKPCVADVKIGYVTWDPDADEEKIACEANKYHWVKETLFQLLGFRVFNRESQQYDQYDRTYCRSLNPKALVREGFGTFFGLPWGLRRDVIASLLVSISNIEDWFNRQRHLHFFGSSLLFVYNGEAPSAEPTANNNKVAAVSQADATEQPSWNDSAWRHLAQAPVAMCKMIDFAHVWAIEDRDSNYLDSLSKLKEFLLQVDALSAASHSNSTPSEDLLLPATKPACQLQTPTDLAGSNSTGVVEAGI